MAFLKKKGVFWKNNKHNSCGVSKGISDILMDFIGNLENTFE